MLYHEDMLRVAHERQERLLTEAMVARRLRGTDAPKRRVRDLLMQARAFLLAVVA